MTVWLHDEHAAQANQMLSTLKSVECVNCSIESYYEGSKHAPKIGIAIPPNMLNLETVLGWPGIAVDALEERLDLLGFDESGELGISQIFSDNGFWAESGMVHLDALIFGVSYVTVSRGLLGEPSVLLTTESPKSATGIYNRRSRQLTAGLVCTKTEPGKIEATLITGDSFIEIRQVGATSWMVLDARPHGFDDVPMVPFFNRRRNSRCGRSQITRPLRTLTDQAVRTLLGMEVNREFYASPQRWVMGASEEDFDGATGWEIVLGKALALERDPATGHLPEVGTFAAASPAPFVEQLRALSQLFAAEAAIPRNYLGFVTENPSSADAIRAEESRLIKHAERRQVQFGASWKKVARIVMQAIGEGVPSDFASMVTPQWRDAATPTRAAAADAVSKLVASDILPARAESTLEMAGLDAKQIAKIQSERAAEGPSGVSALAAAIARQSA